MGNWTFIIVLLMNGASHIQRKGVNLPQVGN